LDTSYNERNNTQRERLKRLANSLSDEQLSREVRDGWTVAGLLAHLAVLDRLRFLGWELQERSPEEHQRWFATEGEINLINDGVQPLLLSIPPREAARMAIEAAEAVDSKIASLPPELVESYQAIDNIHERRMLDRSIHRRSHLDEIEEALGR